jgi:hypothetical protein
LGKLSYVNFHTDISMKQITKYIGMFAILPLVMVALAPNYIGDAEARDSVNRDVVLADPVPDVDLTLKQVFEPQESDTTSVKTERYSSETSDSITYQVVYIVSNSGETDVKNVMISVQSDTETVDADLSGSKSGRNSSLITVFVEASDPSSITAKIVGFEV